MFPLSDFNVVCCALATVSAAVGYRYSKRRTSRGTGPFGRKMRSFSISSSSSDVTLVGDVDTTPSKPNENAYDATEPGSLKRKLREVDVEPDSSTPDDVEWEPSQERCGTPRKKLRIGTPETEEDSDYILIKIEEASPEPPESPVEVTPPPLPLTAEVRSQEPAQSPEQEGKPKSPILEVSQKAPEASPTSPVLPSAFTVPSYKPCTGFSAFASSSTSPFGAALNSSQQPAWRTAFSRSFDPLDPLASMVPISEPLAQSPVDPVDVEQPVADMDSALAAQSYTKTTQTNLTGEEDEEVITELKGAKLFVKRGDKDFSDGIFGHVKYLSHRDTKVERLVFRREPVWKVSMSVRLCPTVRCTFDEDQGILRFTLKEALDGETFTSEAQGQQVVVYALKRGKMPKADFSTFAQQVIKSSHLAQASNSAA